MDIEKETPDFSKGTIITQVFSPYIAGRVKLALLNYLDDEDPIVFVRAAGTRDEVVRPLKLYELDRQKDIDDLTSIYVPPMEGKYDFYTFMRVVEQLRDKDEGCPWDKEQTHASLKKYLIEESYEVLEAIDLEDYESLQEELGDVLLQILLHSTIGKEKGEFNVHEVIRTVAEKMVYRHPHVFKKEEVMTSGEVKDQWEELKKKEKKEASLGQALEKISKFNPSLTRAEKIQGKARKYGFDWQDIDDVFSKLFEEIQEVKDAISDKSQIEVERELGDLLFSVVNLSRFLKVDPEITLNETSDRFVNRIQLMEAEISKAGLDFQALSLENLDKYWENAKKSEK
jgi:tetrapyrrole methylase family protein/MazG family protein